MPTNLYDAHRQWAIRPPDERFPNLEALYAFTRARKECSRERLKPFNQVKLLVDPDGEIAMNGDSPKANLTNWAFGQLCANLGAPAKYLRTLPPEVVQDCLEYGLRNSGEQCKILTRSNPIPGDSEEFLTSAFTGPGYGRIWDADVVENLMKAAEGSTWHVPLAKSSFGSGNSGLYASDRDMFVFMVNDENPVEVGNVKLGRGFFCWNSETGSATFGLTTFLYNYVCGNHIVWGAEEVSELKIIHRNHAPDRFYSQALPVLNRFVENRFVDVRIKDTIGHAMTLAVGETVDRALEWFKDRPFTNKEVTEAWNTGIAEGEDVKTVWGMIQGFTAYARTLSHTDKRVNLERRAGALLAV